MPLFGPPDIEKLKAKRKVNRLVRLVRSLKDPAIRRDATQALIDIGETKEALNTCLALATLGDARALEPLLVLLEHKDREVQKAAAQALGQIGALAVEPLIVILKDKEDDWLVRETAVTLGKIGDARGVEPLIAGLKDEDMDLREAAAWSLGKIGTPAVEPLIVTLEGKDEHAHIHAIYTLGTIGDVRAVEPLVAVLEDENRDLYKAATWALDKLDWKPEPGEAGAQYWITKGNWEMCTTIGTPAVKPLIATLENRDRDVRKGAAWALGQISDPRAVEPLLAALRDKDLAVRDAAARALGKIGDAQAVEPLLAALKEDNLKVRRTAARALGQIGDSRAVEPLVAVFLDKAMRQVAAEALKRLDWQPEKNRTGADYWIVIRDWGKCVEIGPPAVEPLIAALKDADKDVRSAVAEALGRIGAPAVEPLIATLKDDDRDLRFSAAEALGKIGAPAVEPLIAALEDEDYTVRKAGAKALVQIYKSGGLGAKDKESILSRQNEIERLGRDSHTDRPAVCAFPHEDYGSKGFHADFSL